MTIELVPGDDPGSYVLLDRSEQGRLPLKLRGDGNLEPTPTGDDPFPYPVERAWSVIASGFAVRFKSHVGLLAPDGRTREIFDLDTERQLEAGTHVLDLDGPLKCYVIVEGPGTVVSRADGLSLSLPEEGTIAFGVRSHHTRPRHTVSTPPDPESAARAVAALSGSLKTASAERAWPSLRGHPPRIAIGDELALPEDAGPIAPEIAVTVRPTWEDVLAVAPLAYYLGASVRTGSRPRLSAAGTAVALDEPSLPARAARLLRHVLVLDSAVRMAGPYSMETREERELEGQLPFALADAFAADPADRLASYLAVPEAVVEPLHPRWPLVAWLPAEPESLRALPYVCQHLGHVRPVGADEVDELSAGGSQAESVDSPAASAGTRGDEVSAVGGDGRAASSADAAESPLAGPPLPVPDWAQTGGPPQLQAWYGPGAPRGAAAASVAAHEHRLERELGGETLDVLLVCGDADMLAEYRALQERYGSASDDVQVTSKLAPAPDELAERLAEPYHYLHFVGHVTEEGLQCAPETWLDVHELETVRTAGFVLNGCQSVGQALALIERGAVGGLATTVDVPNGRAAEIGRTVFRLLHSGCTLAASLDLLERVGRDPAEYVMVGDGFLGLTKSSSGGSPGVPEIDRLSDGSIRHRTHSFNTASQPMGNVRKVLGGHDSLYRLEGTPSEWIDTDPQTLNAVIQWDSGPALIDGSLRWYDDLRVGLEALLEDN